MFRMKKIGTILFAFLSALALGGCKPEVVASDTFQAEFRLVTEAFHGGEDFVFRVYSNHKSIIITKYDCEFASDNVIVNREYNITDGFHEFREPAVTVAETHRGRINIVVKDPDTGGEKEFSGVYTAYEPYDNYLRIENDVVNSTKVHGGYPTVINGENFSFTVHSNLQKLTLKDFRCEFNDGQLVKGKEYTVNDRGELKFTMKKVSVTQDRYEEPEKLTLTFIDNLSGEEIYLEAQYVALLDFQPRLQVSPSKVSDEGDFKFRLSSNRKNVVITSYMTDPADDANKNGFTPAGLYLNQAVTMNADGYIDYTAPSIVVTSTHNGVLKIAVKDHEYTGREVTLSSSYSASIKPGASNISVDRTKFSVNIGESATINISTTDSHSNKRFSYKLLSANGELELPSKTDDIGSTLTVKGKKSGEVKLRIYATSNTSVYQDVTVFVRYRVALQVEGKFWPWMQQGLNGASDARFSANVNEHVHNWHDAPESMSVSLVTWSGDNTVDPGRTYSYYHPEVFEKTGCNISADFILEYSFDSPSSITMFQGYRGYEECHWTRKGYGAIESALKELSRDFYYQKETTRRSSPETVTSIKNASSLKNHSLPSLATKLQDYDDAMRIQGFNNFIANIWKEYDCPSQWKSFNLFVKITDYNRDMLDIRYVFYKYRAPDEMNYWWKDLDNSNDAWAVPVSSL